MKFMEIYVKPEKMNGYFMSKMTYYQLLSVMLDIQWVRKK